MTLKNRYKNVWFVRKKSVLTAWRIRPAVLPEKGALMRLIDADALFKAFEKTAWYNNADRDEIAEEILLQMPTVDAVEVIRCKDCIHRHVWHSCQGKRKDDFCSYGERKNNV